MDSVTVPVSPNATTTPIPSTGEASVRAAKCFGRVVCKLFIAVPYVLFESLSISTEVIFGVGGAAVGAVRGGSVKLARAAGAKLGLCEKSTKPLKEYVIKDFHRGANLGWLPGQIVGAAGVVASLPVLVNPTMLIAEGINFGIYGLVTTGFAYDEIKRDGHSCAEDHSKTMLSDLRHQFRELHDFLYGDKQP
ncbi:MULTISPECIES: hypothetical protein [Gammaproteobacteria]|uniref:hypothetical protein n=1 Tax=Gammaproteobacteria TaxID=1236 RepID=UPI001ADD01B3|nr:MULTISPECIES: hypothetical protein [Gammaproteobacteria]MBO9480753.1 hypothetical protein [Salinisphaera sp. G21_0]MBO9495493.1 hypothetical protein [Thalassotalea sp. G20_0]